MTERTRTVDGLLASKRERPYPAHRRQAICPHCGGNQLLTRDGRLWMHWVGGSKARGGRECLGAWADAVTGEKRARVMEVQAMRQAPRRVDQPVDGGRCPHGRTSRRVCPVCAR